MAEAIPLRTLEIDWADLEIAFRDNVSGVDSFLDLETGEVVAIIDENDLDARNVAREPERFSPIPGFLFNSYCQFEELAIYERLLYWLAALGINARQAPPGGPTLFMVSSPASFV